jgi:hypothetical protein
MTIHEYLERKYFRINTLAMIKGGKMYRLVNGRWMPEREFERIFPLPLKVGMKPNPDSRKTYLL